MCNVGTLQAVRSRHVDGEIVYATAYHVSISTLTCTKRKKPGHKFLCDRIGVEQQCIAHAHSSIPVPTK